MGITIERQELLELFDSETIHENEICLYEYSRSYSENYTLYLYIEVLAERGSICLKDDNLDTIVFELFFHPQEKVRLKGTTLLIYTAKKALRASVQLEPMASLQFTV